LHPNPDVARIIKQKAAEMGIARRSFTDEEILRRLLFASVNEACKILEEGKAHRASDIDVMWLNGFGFPRYRGGLMYWADGIGDSLPTDSGVPPASVCMHQTRLRVNC
jgi:3-hydroxyacyl-CoA dehydrogenase